MRITLPSGTEAEFERPAEQPTMGLVIAPDIFGLRPLYDSMVARMCSVWNMSTVAVEPFPGLDLGDDIEARMAAVADLRDADHLRDLEEAAEATGCDTIGLIGFCMGGMYCFRAATCDRFARIASFYGMIRVPADWNGEGHGEPLDALARGHDERVLAIIGDLDPYTPPDDVAALEIQLDVGRRIGGSPTMHCARRTGPTTPPTPLHVPSNGCSARWAPRRSLSAPAARAGRAAR